MGNLVKNGAGETAAKSFQALTKEFEKNGKGAKEALDALPGYKDALWRRRLLPVWCLSAQDFWTLLWVRSRPRCRALPAATETYTTQGGQSAPVTEDMAKALEAVGLSARAR